MIMPVIEKEEKVLDDKLVIEEARISDEEGNTYKKLRVNRPDAVGVLLLNTDIHSYILTRQFRYPIADKTSEPILEILAGKIDDDEKMTHTAIRETLEETGYKVTEKSLQFLTSCFASPGYSSECFHLYFAIVTNQDKITNGGGLEEENEHIEIVEIPVDTFDMMLQKGGIRDAKTYIAGLLAKDRLPF
jgi:nudix-type nucleoside diphosphatase (YffH/AdpP family)